MKNVSFVRIYNNNDNNNHDKPLFSLNYPANTLMEKRGGINIKENKKGSVGRFKEEREGEGENVILLKFQKK